jgi:hypothetical protein
MKMKRYIYSVLLSFAVLLAACDYNERNFPGLNEMSRPVNIHKGELAVTEADLPAVIAALNASGESEASVWTAALGRDKAFSDEAPAERILPRYLRSLYYGADAGSTVDVTWVTTVGSATGQFILSTAGWMFDPTVVKTLVKSDYQAVVDYVLRTHAVENPALVHYAGNAEYYYGFSAYYGNITCRETDRSKDTAYPKAGSAGEKAAFMNARTVDGLGIYLSETMPHLQPEVNGITQLAKLTVLIYSDPVSSRQNVVWTYTLRCTAPGVWEFVERQSDDGTVETEP